MKYTATFFTVLCAAFLGGCIPLTQTDIYPRDKGFTAHIDNRKCLAIALQADSPKAAESLNIDTKYSYIISPKGKKYSVEIKYYENSTDSFWRQGVVYIASTESKIRWDDGIWTLHFSLLPLHKYPDINSKLKIWTFYYNPLIHGPPN